MKRTAIQVPMNQPTHILDKDMIRCKNFEKSNIKNF